MSFAGRPSRWSPWPQLAVAVLAIAVVVVLGLTYILVEREAAGGEAREARATAQLQVAALQSELDKQRSVPVILADDSDVVRSLAEPTPQRARSISEKLARLQQETHSAAIYVIDPTGRTLSASNFATPASFVDSNYAFRPYFVNALRQGQAEQFALGTVSLRPGLYIAHRVEVAGRALGVVVVKVEFDSMETDWARARARTFVTNAAGRVLLTSIPGWRFLPAPVAGSAGHLTTLPAPAPGWRLNLLTSRKEAASAARSATVIAAMAMAIVGGLIVWQWRRRRHVAERAAAEGLYRQRLESEVAARTQELRGANARLSEEISERLETERRLNAAQVDLVQANKLAQLGQITAGVAHEINQPLATIRILTENSMILLTRQGAKPAASSDKNLVEQNLGDIVRMSERIGHITGELRTFSRKATGDTGPVPLRETIDSSILLNRSRLRHNAVKLVRLPIDPKLQVIGSRIRLEQVLVNLLQNAFEALENTPDPVVRVTSELGGEWVWLRVSDNGPGIAPEVMAQIFTPFLSTKEKGLGLGLVIAHDILREFGGELSAESGPEGAVFTLKLRNAGAL